MEQVLYKLPIGWEWKRIEDVFTITSGKNLTSKDMQEDGKFPVYGGNGIVGRHSNYNLDGSNIIIGRVGALCGNVRLVNEKIWVTDNAFFIKDYKVQILKEYLAKLLAALNLGEAANRAAQPVISYKGIKELSIPYPPMSEQKRIVEKLDALLTRIDTAVEHLLKNVMLTDVLLKNGLAQIFEALIINCEVVPLSSVVKINSGIALPNIFKNGFSDGDLPFYKVAQMNNHHEFMIDPEITFNERIGKEHKIKLFPKGSTLIPKRGGAILTNKKRLLLEDASYDSNIMGLKADESKISDDYLFAFMRTIDLANFVDASTIPQVNNKHIDQMQIPLASIEEQADVVSRVNLLVKKVETMNSEIQSQLDDLQALKNSILDSAFKGEL